jgi:tetratricopeptide (TPR) repeat protein
MCIDGRRVSEAIEWADAAAQIPGDAAPANLLASRALARTGRWREALERAALAGPAGKTLAAKLEAQRELLEKSDSSAALTHYRKARTAMKAGDYSRAADESRRAVALAPWEVVYRAFAVHAVCAVRGPSEGRKVLDDYLGLFPEDPYATAMADALKATIETDYSRPGLAARAQLMLGDVPEAAPPAAALTAMARRAGWERRPAELVGRLSASGASREMRMALPVLQQRGIPFKVGNGSLDDLRAKLAGDAPVLVQMPPGKLAGLRSGEKFSAGVPALVIGYDDGLRGVIVLEPGASKPRRIPYGLFDRLWSATDRWWLAIPPRGSSLPGKEGELTKLELGTALLASGGLRAASPLLEAELERHPRRAQLGMALLALARQQPDAARKRLSALSAAGPEYAIQVEHALGTLEDQLGEGPRADRLEKALPHYRAAWDLDPGVERSTLVLSAALLTRRKAGDVAEGRRILDDYLRFHPSSLAALRLYYSR